MKCRVSVFLILLITAAVAALAEEAPLKVFVFAGQSNMVGRRCEVSALPDPLTKPQDKALYFDGNQWLPLKPGVTEPDGFGPEISCAAALQKRIGEPIGIIKLSNGGTSLAKRWDPENPDDLYHQLKVRVQAAQKSRPVEIVGMFWMQGERDSKEDTMATAYAENLRELIERAREDFGAPNMLFVAGRVNPPEPEFPYVQKVREAQATLDIADYGFIDCDDLEKGADDLHYTTPGVIIMGERFAEKALALLSSPETKTPPPE